MTTSADNISYVCPRCFGDKELARQVSALALEEERHKCSFCNGRNGANTRLVADIIDKVFRDNYSISSHLSDLDQYNKNGYEIPSGMDPLEAIGELTQCADENISQVLLEHLQSMECYDPQDGGERFYSDDYLYYQHSPEDGSYGRAWDNFKESIINEERFFSGCAKDLLFDIFNDIEHRKSLGGKPVVYCIGPQSELQTVFRARLANGINERKQIEKQPWTELGPPPEGKRQSGRMNPAGIPAFYGALDLDTCTSELRPPVGSTLVGAEFEMIRPICALDLSRFAGKPHVPSSLFHPDHHTTITHWAFLQTFRREVSRPILPDDEHLGYVPTQAIAEYVNRHHPITIDGEKRCIEAIIFPSAQHPKGKNIVFLGAAASVETPSKERLKGTSCGDMHLIDYLTPPPPKPALRVIPGTLTKMSVVGARYRTRKNAMSHISVLADLDP
jgi:hypothetical protein